MHLFIKENRCHRFNLVIEVLLISRRNNTNEGKSVTKFQSRNRGSFDFKDRGCSATDSGQPCFNLVIEVLLISSQIRLTRQAACPTCFNLVIEVLLISSQRDARTHATHARFQSRNRGSFDFKPNPQLSYQSVSRLFQSRNRGSFDFKRAAQVHGYEVSMFQSRNRGSFDFKLRLKPNRLPRWIGCFNLVIEVLLISSKTKKKTTLCQQEWVSIS